MASVSDILSTATIDSLVNSYISNEQSKKIDPLTTRKTKYQNLSTAYSTLSTKLSALKSLLSDLKNNDTSSVFLTKTAASSNTDFVSVVATGAAATSSYVLRVNQLAKNDLLLGVNLDSNAYSSVITTEGSHTFRIKTGDGSGGEYIANVGVSFEASDFDTSGITNKALMQKISNAINLDKAVVTSDVKNGSDTYSGGESSFTININGTEKIISITSATDYNDLISQLVSSINTNVTGVTAEKIVDGNNVSLKMTVNDSSKYISISNSTGFDLVSDLNISATKEKAASGIVTASVFSPVSGKSQLSLTSKEAGNDYRVTELYESGGSNLALNSIGIDFGTSRTSYVQNPGGEDTAGFVYDTSLLNSKFEFNGINMERNSNSISDLIDGATVNLKSVMQSSDTDVAITFAIDNATIKAKIKDFVTKFNDIYIYIKSQSASSLSGSRGIFIGDANASSLLSTFTSSAYSSISGINENEINSLSRLGITFNPNSGLSISDSQLEKAISENVEQVAELFNSSNGIASSLYTRINSYIGTTGYLTKAKTLADKSITNINDSITKAQDKIDKAGESLRSRYQQLQLQISSLLSMQSMLFGS